MQNRKIGELNSYKVGPIGPNDATIIDMQLVNLAMRLLGIMFFVGLAGSAVVVLISFVEDAKELFGHD